MELKFTMYYVSSDAFTYIVTTHCRHAKYDDPCLIA